MNKKIRALGVVLPQFHPIPENDKWWGKGFTEWTNVVKALPRFKNHYQPHLPADLGFYDLRLPQARAEQAKIAQDHGIYGLCIHHYWFNGKQLIDQPVNEMIRLNEPNVPFMLCWANENWTRRWDGLDQEVLIQQDYTAEDHRNHCKWLCENIFNDERYIRVNGKPFFLFFNADIIPNIEETIKIWKNEAKNNGFDDIYLGGVRTAEGKIPNAQKIGFDIAIEWQPDWKNLFEAPSILQRLLAKLGLGQNYRSMDYEYVVSKMISKSKPADKHFHCVMPSWDNSARRKNNPFIIKDSTPNKYKHWLEAVCEKTEVYSDDENFIFINAMNEWAEGNHLEPDQKWGTKYLEKTKEVLRKYL